MVRVDKCPNCAAFLEARRPGVSRRCVYCNMEVVGLTATADVQASSVEEAVAQKLAELRAQPPSMYRPPPLAPPPMLGPMAKPGKSSGGSDIGGWVVKMVVPLVVVFGAAGFMMWRNKASQDEAAARVAAATANAAKTTPPSGLAAASASGDKPVAASLAPGDMNATGDAAHFDATATLWHLLAAAGPGPDFLGLSVDGVGADGLATLSKDGGAIYTLRAPLAGVGDVDCKITLTVATGSTAAKPTVTKLDAAACVALPTIRPPACTVKQVAERAFAKGASKDAKLLVSLGAAPGATAGAPRRGVWTVTPAGGEAMSITDTCDLNDLPVDVRVMTASGMPPADGNIEQDPRLLGKLLAPVRGKIAACLDTHQDEASSNVDITVRLEAHGRHDTLVSGHIEARVWGMVNGDINDMKDKIVQCTGKAMHGVKVPGGHPLVLSVNFERGGAMKALVLGQDDLRSVASK